MTSDGARLTSTSYAVLSLLDLLGEATPYELKQALVVSIENFWPVPHTTFYEEPSRLAKAGYLSVEQEDGGRRRKRYALTDSGRRALREWANSPEAAPPQLRDESMLKIFAGADPAPVLERRAQWQNGKLAELEGYLQALQDRQDGPREDRWRGAETTLMAGIAYHRQQIELIERYLTRGADADSATAERHEDAAPADGAQTASGSAPASLSG